MPPPPVGSFGRVTIIGRYQGQEVENTMVYKAQTPADLNDPDVFHAAVIDAWQGTYLADMAEVLVSTFQFRIVRSQIFTPTITYVAQESVSVIDGQVATLGMPAEVALVTTKLSLYAGKTNRGRNYWSGLPASAFDQTTGFWTEGSIAVLLGRVNTAYTTPLNTTAPTRRWDPVVTDGALQRSTLITASGYNKAPRSQRRRQVGRGI